MIFKSMFSGKKIDLKKIKIHHNNDVSPDFIQRLYLSVGWQYREIQDIKKSLNNSILVTTAWKDEFLIGMSRATGDGIFNATIWDVAVRPDYQNQGIGSLIIKSMLTKLDDHGISLITLYSECAKKNFYSKLGFESNSAKIIGMYRHKAR